MELRDSISVIDQFSAREACSVLAALRVFQQVRAAGGTIPPHTAHADDPYCFTCSRTINELEHFEDSPPLSDSEIDELAERIAVRWPDDRIAPTDQ